MFYKSKIIIFEFKRTEDKLSRLRDLVQQAVIRHGGFSV